VAQGAVRVAFEPDLVLAFRSSFHFRRSVVPGERGQLVDDCIRPNPRDLTDAASSASAVTLRAQFSHRARRLRRTRQRKHDVTVLFQASDEWTADRAGD
jgi:hypothetical protein